MTTIDDFSRTIAAIYASAVTPENWAAVLGYVQRTLDAQACALALADGSSRSVATGSLAPEARTAYGEYYHQIDYVLEAVEKSPVGLIRGGQSLVALQTRSEFHADFMRPYEVDDGVFVRLTDGPTTTSILVAAPKRTEPFDTAERVKLLGAHPAGALIGFAATVGALGGVAINLTLRQSYATTGSETWAYGIFPAAYVVASVLTWRRYVRRPDFAPAVPRPAAESAPNRL